MASEPSPSPAATATSFAPFTSQPATHSTIASADVDSSRTRSSLKRVRADYSQSPGSLALIANAGLVPSIKSPRLKGSFTPAPLTGAAAMEDERQRRAKTGRTRSSGTSDNPSIKVMSSLMAGVDPGISKAQDAPIPTTAMSEGMTIAANAITIPTQMSYDRTSAVETSPASVTSLASLGTTAQTATASPTVVASPGPMSSLSDVDGKENQSRALVDDIVNRAFSYPGNRNLQPDASRAPPRGLSLPMPGASQLAPRSPSQKKHKCPYCPTEFTRHHNLKSHLLTHSQEKPYVCQHCQMRFRRLHDLKRHMKLHTGERPHICPKCDRKFARGDALARHSKGTGGCAGRRASMGSFGGDDDYEGSNAGDEEAGMDGVTYSNGASQDNESEMTEEERRRFSLPSIRAQHAPGNQGNQGNQENYTSFTRSPSTYPPIGPRPAQPSGSLYPPNTDRGSSSSGTNPSMQGSGPSHTPSMSMALSTAGASLYAQSVMTESPKPLSPAGMQSHQLGHDTSINRTRSPSVTTQFQQQNFGRHQSGRASPSSISLPSPHGTAQQQRLPSLAGSGLAPPDQKYTLSSQAAAQQMLAASQQGPPKTSPPNTTFLPPRSFTSGPQYQGHQSSSGDSSNNLFAGGESGLLSYVKTLETRVEQMGSDINDMKARERLIVDQMGNDIAESHGREKILQEQNRNLQDQIKRLAADATQATELITYLRGQVGSQNHHFPPPVSGAS